MNQNLKAQDGPSRRPFRHSHNRSHPVSQSPAQPPQAQKGSVTPRYPAQNFQAQMPLVGLQPTCCHYIHGTLVHGCVVLRVYTLFRLVLRGTPKDYHHICCFFGGANSKRTHATIDIPQNCHFGAPNPQPRHGPCVPGLGHVPGLRGFALRRADAHPLRRRAAGRPHARRPWRETT